MNRINIHPVPFQPNIQNLKQQSSANSSKFAHYLGTFTNNETIKVSKHANERMQLRDISITESEWDLISNKVNEAKSKGVNQPLVLLDHAALIVSARNNTVITAMDRNEAKEQLFTNIDGTIVL
jgi:flagellar operon protein